MKKVIESKNPKQSRIKSKFNKCYKFRIYPTENQQKILIENLNECRHIYNKLIKGLKIQSIIFKDVIKISESKEWTKYYTGSGFDLERKPKKEGTNYAKLYSIFERYFPDCVKSKLDRGNTQKIVTYYINLIYPESKKFPFAMLQYENHRIFRQLRSLKSNRVVGRKVGLLKFKGEDFFNSFTYNTQGFKFSYDEGSDFGKLSLGSGRIAPERKIILKTRVHRPIEGIIKNVIIKKEGTKWFAILITCYVDGKIPKIKKSKLKKKLVGIDLGLGNFIYDSDGNSWVRKKIFEEFEIPIKKLNRKLSKAKLGSSNRKKTKLFLSNIYAKRTRVREDYIHKISTYYAINYDLVAAEDLNINEMVLKKKKKGKKMRAHILDASWSKFLDMLEYKLKSKGGELIRVNPKNTSKSCSRCGNIKEDLKLKDRVYICERCGLKIDRDYNASLNVLKIYTQELGSLEQSKEGLVENK